MSAAASTTVEPTSGPKCKICCACPAERRVRDECVIFNGMEKCIEPIEAFYTCLLKEGFSQDQVDSLRKRSRQ
jgi:cytochrome c oxidase assembly protein subunit 17